MVQKIKTIKPLVIGLGVAGKRHLEAQLNLGNKTGVYSINPKSTQSFQNQKNIIVFDNLEKAIAWSNLVHVCTPDDKHTEYVALAIKNDKAVLCEKAFTTNLENALYLRDLSHKNNVVIIIAQNYRLTPTFAETKKRVSNGDLGQITKIETSYLHDATQYQQRAPANKNKDFLYVGGSHAIDLALWIADEKVVSIEAKMTQTANFPNSYKIILNFESGLLGYAKLDASSSRPYNGTNLIVTGTKGELISHNKIDELIFYKGRDIAQTIKFPNNETLTTAEEIKIVDSYLTGKVDTYKPLPNIDEAVDVIKILDVIQKASLSNKKEFII